MPAMNLWLTRMLLIWPECLRRRSAKTSSVSAGREHVRAHLGELRHRLQLVRLDEVDAAHEALVGVAKLVAVVEAEEEGGAGVPFRLRLYDVEAAGEHRVDDHDASAGEREEEEFAVAMHVAEGIAGEETNELISWYSDKDRDERSTRSIVRPEMVLLKNVRMASRSGTSGIPLLF